MSSDEVQVETLGPFSFDPSKPDGGIPNIGEMLRAAINGKTGGPDDRSLADRLQLLQEGYDRYVQCHGTHHGDKRGPFKPGDWVTPVAVSALRGAGDPSIVVETRTCEPDFDSVGEIQETCSHTYGERRNIRMMTYSQKHVVCHWVPSHELAYYEPPAE